MAVINKQKTITIQQASALYGMNHQNIRAWIKESKLDAFKVGRQWYFETDEFERFIGLSNEPE